MNHTSDAAAAPVPARIRARVHDGALQRVTRMFAATLTPAAQGPRGSVSRSTP